MNHSCYGDWRSRFFSLVLRDSLAIESVDDICLDPSFNSKRDCNLLFKLPRATAAVPLPSARRRFEALEDTERREEQLPIPLAYMVG